MYRYVLLCVMLFLILQSGFLLKQYSVIILDEVHVRSYSTDILMGMLLRVSIAHQVTSRVVLMDKFT